MRRIAAFSSLLALGLIAGCGPSASPLVEKYKPQFLQSELDGNLISIKDAMMLEGAVVSEGEAELGSNSDELPTDPNADLPSGPSGPLVVAGKIYGGDVPAFDSAKASFTMIELQEPGHDHEDPGDCVFCKRRLESAEMALVHLVDENGNIIELPADQLLGLKSGMNILAKGKVELLGEMLVIRATELSLMDESQAKEVYTTLNPAE